MNRYRIRDEYTITEIGNGFILYEESGTVITTESKRYYPTYEAAAREIIRLIEESLAEMKGEEQLHQSTGPEKEEI